MPDNWLKWIFTGLALLTVLIFNQSHVGSPNDAARMATIQALAEQHTFSLDSVILKSDVDIMRRNGHNMSDKPPMLQFLAAVIYYPFYLVGIDFTHHYGWVYYFLTFIFSGLPYIGLVWLTGLILSKLGWNLSGKIVTLLLMGWGTIILPFAITFNNHLFTAFLILWGVYWYGFHLTGIHSKPWQWVLLGGILSLAFTLEFPTGGYSHVILPGTDWDSISGKNRIFSGRTYSSAGNSFYFKLLSNWRFNPCLLAPQLLSV